MKPKRLRRGRVALSVFISISLVWSQTISPSFSFAEDSNNEVTSTQEQTDFSESTDEADESTPNATKEAEADPMADDSSSDEATDEEPSSQEQADSSEPTDEADKPAQDPAKEPEAEAADDGTNADDEAKPNDGTNTDGKTKPNDGANKESTPETTTSNGQAGIPEWAFDSGINQLLSAQEDEGLPKQYDLRTQGIVTPVKMQSPWGSCWSFGGIAAAETSILTLNKTDYAHSGIDLSERHLAYFALSPVTASTNSTQVGEGVHLFDTSRNAPFANGGNSMHVTTLFSQGVGPLSESSFPYRGVDGQGKSHTNVEYFELHPKEIIDERIAEEAQKKDMTYEQYIDYLYTNPGEDLLAIIAAHPDWTKEQVIEELFRPLVLDELNAQVAYTDKEDWSIPETDSDGNSNRLITGGYVLSHGNVLPEYWNENKTDNSASVRAIKKEINKGHGVTITYYSEKDDVYGTTGDIYTRYVDEPIPNDHMVCIVGWDDDFSKSNFNEGHQPTKDGAWICKNSWGSETDVTQDDLGNMINRSDYGTIDADGRHTGYFYLSYEDKTITDPESLEFASDLGRNKGFYTAQHDYMPGMDFYTPLRKESLVGSANVFMSPKETILKSVSTRTAEPNMHVTFTVYLLNDTDERPVPSGERKAIYQGEADFEYSGFHRFEIPNGIRIGQGQVFSIVSSTYALDGGKKVYSVSANQGVTEETARKNSWAYYVKGVVNPGESYIYDDGSWQDWSAYLAKAGGTGIIDNFSIKAYLDPADTKPLAHIPAVVATCTTAGNIEYWRDEDTGKLYQDASGFAEITQADTVVNPFGHNWDEGVVTKEPTDTEPGVRTFTCGRCGETRTEEIPVVKATYACTKGDGASWTKGNKNVLSFTFERTPNSAATFDHFTGIAVDGKEVDADNYDASSGSVVVNLKASYLEGLSVDNHKLTAQFDDGSADASFAVKAASGTSGNGSNSTSSGSSGTSSSNRTTSPSSGTTSRSNTTLPGLGDDSSTWALPTLMAAVMAVVAAFIVRRRAQAQRE